MNINANDGLKLKDSKIEMRPVDMFELLASNGGDFALRLDNTGGSGNEAMTIKAGDLHFVPYKQLQLRNRDNTKPLVTLDTGEEAIDVSVKDFRLFNGGGQSFVTKLLVTSGGYRRHDQSGGGIEAGNGALAPGDRVWLGVDAAVMACRRCHPNLQQNLRLLRHLETPAHMSMRTEQCRSTCTSAVGEPCKRC